MCAEMRHCQRWVTNRERQRVPQWRTRDRKTSLSVSRRSCSRYRQIAACCRSEMTSASGSRNQTSSGPRYDACVAPDERRQRLASGADLHASERYDGAQPCSDLNISVASLKSTTASDRQPVKFLWNNLQSRWSNCLSIIVRLKSNLTRLRNNSIGLFLDTSVHRPY